MELLKLLNMKLIIAQMVCFFLVLWVLKKFLWKPVFTILEDRRRKIDEQIKGIEQTRAEAAALRVEMEKALANIDATAQAKLKEVEHLGEQKTRAMKDQARVEAEKIIEDARVELRYEFQRSREALKGEVVDMVMKVTEQMIQEKLTFAEDKKLVEGLLTELDKVEKGHER